MLALVRFAGRVPGGLHILMGEESGSHTDDFLFSLQFPKSLLDTGRR